MAKVAAPRKTSGRKKAAPLDLVAVLCCMCGRPTALRVPPAVLEEVEIWHICSRCAREDPPEPAPAE